MTQLNLLTPELLEEITTHPVKPQSGILEKLKLLAQMGMHCDLINDYHHLARAISKSVVRHAVSQGWGKRKLSHDKSADADLPTEMVTAKSLKDKSKVVGQLTLF
ncbi:MAG: hypothetical protein HC789_05380 [Microcoleus sp. CSU_2_2]|nr:hypothetical protein [Microcoleus sp. SU_5_3]NJS09843.1 hypothetical protein [Microcoleus sp. CSU_2_2]